MNFGVLTADSDPTAEMRYWAVTVSPVSVVIVQRPVSSSKVAAVTLVLNWMSLARSKRSVTCSR